MTKMKIMSLNGEDMVDLIPKNFNTIGEDSQDYWRAKLLAAMIQNVDPDILGLVEAPPYQVDTRKFVDNYIGGSYTVYQGEKRGLYGIAILVRNGLEIDVNVQSKKQSLKDFKLGAFDADEDGIKENYSWWNRVPLEAEFAGDDLNNNITFIVIHAKSKGAFIPGDLFAYDKLSRANRMKLKAQGHAVRMRLDQLINEKGEGRVVVMGDMNDSPKFDVYFAMLGKAFLEPVMGSVWDPVRIMHNCHATMKKEDLWTIDFKDRVVNPLDRSRFGQPSELRSWIDHILVSPQLKDSVVPNSFGILHKQPRVEGLPKEYSGMRGTDHHPPYVTLDL